MDLLVINSKFSLPPTAQASVWYGDIVVLSIVWLGLQLNNYFNYLYILINLPIIALINQNQSEMTLISSTVFFFSPFIQATVQKREPMNFCHFSLKNCISVFGICIRYCIATNIGTFQTIPSSRQKQATINKQIMTKEFNLLWLINIKLMSCCIIF